MQSITTLMNVNTRVGPGTVYDKKSQVRRATTLEYSQTVKDESGVIWYYTNQGWISGRFVSHAKDIKNKVSTKNRIFNIQQFEDDEDPDTDDEESSEDEDDPDTDPNTTNVDEAASESEEKPFNIDDYIDSDASYGLSNYNDLFLGKRLFGIPYQFLPSTDIRIGNLHNKGQVPDAELGYNYYEMMGEVPILSVIPGSPQFLPDLSDTEKDGITNYLSDMVKKIQDDSSKSITDRVVQGVMENMNVESRFFSFSPCYSKFARYFNTLCQMNAIMMGLGDELVPGESGDEYKFRWFNWTSYTLANKMAGRHTTNENQADPNSNLFDFKSTLQQIKDFGSNLIQGARDLAARAMDDENPTATSTRINNINAQYYTDFIISPNVGFSESFNNEAGPSQISQVFGGFSDMTKEIGFLIDSGSLAASAVDKTGNAAATALEALGSGAGGSSSLLKKIGKGATTILKGANLVFPEIWKNSSYNQSYNIEILLATPYGTPKSIFMDILVPLWFWIAITAPRQASANSFMSPFLIRCHVPGLLSVDTGLVESLTVTKGGNNTEWSVDGYPLEIKLNINIRDLYKSLSISALHGVGYEDAMNFLWNTGLIDYVSVQSGLDMRCNEFQKKFDVAQSLLRDNIDNFFRNPLSELQENINRFIGNQRT